ncbi:hypothetical protein CERSUDRAFT_125854 [Gelatoporia subvermispora B]|uniref:HNH nuclease domain-containing protein n=1 Tax=Ceriporiopsis subvermispora (strain B) TaxID=914234 RepID=M2QB07_CERS8|nr:hypothetical protein CERSUDRAFT_125854 [Gelatoporia subvermispora B]
MSSPPINDCPLPGHILLLLLPNREFGLHIPIQDALQLCTRPLKYLRYLAWVVLHLEGKITCNSVEVDEEKGTFEDQQTYRFEPGPLRSWDDARPINAEIADRRSSSATNSSRLHEFADNLRERDISCVFTGYTFAEAMHIVPFSKGNEWLERLVGGRFPGRSTNEGEDLGELDINHVSNGFLTFSGIHMCTDRRVAAVIVTPNRVLSCDDIPPSLPRLFERPTGIEYPTGIRYTFQWLHATGRSNDELRAVPNNSDAAFNSASEQRRPSPFLLECMYAATVVKFWGLHPDRLRMHPKFISAPPRKSRPSLGFKPTRSSDRSITIGKPNRFRQNSAGAMGVDMSILMTTAR